MVVALKNIWEICEFENNTALSYVKTATAMVGPNV